VAADRISRSERLWRKSSAVAAAGAGDAGVIVTAVAAVSSYRDGASQGRLDTL